MRVSVGFGHLRHVRPSEGCLRPVAVHEGRACSKVCSSIGVLPVQAQTFRLCQSWTCVAESLADFREWAGNDFGIVLSGPGRDIRIRTIK